MRRLLALLVLPAIAAGLVACKGYGDVSKAVELDESDDGRTVSVHETDVLIITLSSNQSTGYSWQLTERPSSVLELVAQDYEVEDEDTDGGGGVEIWRFGVRSGGRTSLRLEYIGPNGGEASRTFSLTVEAEEVDQ